MSVLGDVEGGVSGVLSGQLWKVTAIVLASLLLAGGGAGGALWWTAAAARDKALAELAAEKGVTAQLRAGVDAQNTAIQTQAQLAREAEKRGEAARAAADANGRRYDAALTALAGARATSCDDAMPYVNKVLESAR